MGTTATPAETAPATPAARHRRGAAWLWETNPGEFSPALLEIIEAPSPPRTRIVVCVLVALFGAAFLWSWFGHLSVYAEAPGRIQVLGRSKVIEPQQVGTVLRIVAHDGDHVQPGDLLVQLDPIDAQAAQAELAGKVASVKAEIVRWPIEIAAAHADVIDPDAAIVWPDDTPPALRTREQAVLRAALARLAATLADLQAQRRTLQTRSDGLSDRIAGENRLIATLTEQLGMVEQLQREGWNSQARLLEIQAARTQAQVELSAQEGKLAETRAAIPVVESQMVDAREELAKVGEQQLATLERDADVLTQKLAQATQSLGYMTLRAPVGGTVQASALTTVGQVVKPGQQLMQLVPDHSAIEILAYVPNSSIGFVREGQRVLIKVQTYVYTNYGTVPGAITQVAHNELAMLQRNTLQVASLDGTASATTAAENTGTLVYPITVVPDSDSMMVDGRKMPLTPGMAVTVDVLTERRQLLDYIASPLIELFSTAAHER